MVGGESPTITFADESTIADESWPVRISRARKWLQRNPLQCLTDAALVSFSTVQALLDHAPLFSETHL